MGPSRAAAVLGAAAAQLYGFDAKVALAEGAPSAAAKPGAATAGVQLPAIAGWKAAAGPPQARIDLCSKASMIHKMTGQGE